VIQRGTGGISAPAIEEFGRVGAGLHDRACLRLDEALGPGVIEEAQQVVVETVHVQQPARLGVQAELRPGDRLEQFLEGADAARQRDERVGVLGHPRLALVHRVDDVHRGDAGVADLAGHERVRDHADHFTASIQHRVGDDAHQTDVAAAVDEAMATGDQRAAERPRGRGVGRADTVTRSTEDADAAHAGAGYQPVRAATRGGHARAALSAAPGSRPMPSGPPGLWRGRLGPCQRSPTRAARAVPEGGPGC
jgi:hypothetical protein